MKKVPQLLYFITLSLTLLPIAREAEALSTRREMPDLLGIKWVTKKDNPTTRATLQGKVALIHFWNLNCADCIRNIEPLKTWDNKYASNNLAIIGVHTPFEDFEKKEKLVERFVKEKFIYYPVATDNDATLSTKFNVTEWPSMYLVDARGRIRHVYKGHGNYDNIELQLQDLMTEKGHNLAGLEIEDFQLRTDPVQYKTENILLGYTRLNRFGHNNKITAGKAYRYTIPQLVLPERLYLEGEWEMHETHTHLAKGSGKLLIRYRGNGLSLVMGSGNTFAIDTDITLNGHPMTAELSGKNIVFQQEKGLAIIKDYKLYQLIDTDDDYSEKEVILEFKTSGVDIYRLEFGNVEKYKPKTEVELIREQFPIEKAIVESNLLN